MPNPLHVPLPDVTCGPACTEQHTYRLNECALCCADIDGGYGDMSWTVACPDCKASANRPCRRWNGTAASVTCGRRWNLYDAKQKARPPAPPARTRAATTPEGNPPVTNEAPRPTECPAGVHSIYDPCPGDCGKLLEDTAHTDTTAQARAERDAALRLADVWDDAPDPLARAMARDLRSVIRGARPNTATEATVEQIRAERDQYAAALDKVRDFNKLVADGSCRVQAVEQARDTLHLLDRSLNAPTRPPRHEKGQS